MIKLLTYAQEWEQFWGQVPLLSAVVSFGVILSVAVVIPFIIEKVRGLRTWLIARIAQMQRTLKT